MLLNFSILIIILRPVTRMLGLPPTALRFIFMESVMTLETLKVEVLELMKQHHKIPGKISVEEVKGFYDSIQKVESICNSIESASISWGYYNGISWSRKSYKEFLGKNYNTNESFQYYRSPYFSIEYSSKDGFKVKRNEACKEIRKYESDIDEFVRNNDYVYYAIKVFLKDENDFEDLKSQVETIFYCRVEKREFGDNWLGIIIPHSNTAITKELKELTLQMESLSSKIKTVSDTISCGFFLGGQRETTHLQIYEDEYGDVRYHKQI